MTTIKKNNFTLNTLLCTFGSLLLLLSFSHPLGAQLAPVRKGIWAKSKEIIRNVSHLQQHIPRVLDPSSTFVSPQCLHPVIKENAANPLLKNPFVALAPESCYLQFQDEQSFQWKALKESLKNTGIAFVQVQDENDKEGKALAAITERIGVFNIHSQDKESRLWHIKYDPKAVQSGCAARSQTDKEFEDHTDCSFEENPPRLFGLYVVKKDELGGGKNELVRVQDLLEQLSPESVRVLKETDFPTKIPPEFFKGIDQVSFPILSDDGLIRYRRDCFIDGQCSPEQLMALDEVEKALKKPEIRYDLFLPKGVIAFIDNAAFLHSRTPILDRERHLIRARFHIRPEEDGQYWLKPCQWKKQGK